MHYQINGWLKIAEVDNFENGCDPDTTKHIFGNEVLTAKSKKEIVKKFADFCNADKDEIQLNACDEHGRIDCQIMENDAGDKASKADLESFNQGKLRLWLCEYIGHVEKVRVERVKL